MRDLGAVPGEQASIAYAIDERARVVGASGSCFIDNFNPVHAFLWQNGLITDLNTLIPATAGLQLIVAFGINARGQIVACGLEPSGNVHAVLLTPAHDANSRPGAATAMLATQISEKPTVVLSGNVRRLLRRPLRHPHPNFGPVIGQTD